ncbi:MAG: hypothetical protein M3Q79_02940 [bacterium]|nr:hypothetical protein [bacterium]
MDNLQDLISNNSFTEPPQLKAIRDYVKQQYDSDCSVTVTPRSYVLAVPSASLASNLQLEKQQIESACNLDKPLRIRFGS